MSFFNKFYISAALMTVPPGFTLPFAAYIYAFVGGFIPKGFDSGAPFYFGGSTFDATFGGILLQFWSDAYQIKLLHV